MDTSNRADLFLINQGLISEASTRLAEEKHGNQTEQAKKGEDNREMEPMDTTDTNVDQLIKDTEKSRAQVYELPGKSGVLINQQSSSPSKNVDVLLMDQDYQMIDSHIDEALKQKNSAL